MHEGPGVSISLVGGRNSSIGFIMTSNLSFHAVSCRNILNWAIKNSWPLSCPVMVRIRPSKNLVRGHPLKCRTIPDSPFFGEQFA